MRQARTCRDRGVTAAPAKRSSSSCGRVRKRWSAMSRTTSSYRVTAATRLSDRSNMKRTRRNSDRTATVKVGRCVPKRTKRCWAKPTPRQRRAQHFARKISIGPAASRRDRPWLRDQPRRTFARCRHSPSAASPMRNQFRSGGQLCARSRVELQDIGATGRRPKSDQQVRAALMSDVLAARSRPRYVKRHSGRATPVTPKAAVGHERQSS